MRQLGMEAVFQSVQRFVAREWPLLLPVTLFFFALPWLAIDLLFPDAMRLLMPGTAPGVPGQGAAMVVTLAAGAAYCLGALVLSALLLVPAVSVREAIVRAGRRWPRLAGAVLLVIAAVLLAMTMLALLLARVLPAAVLQHLLLVVIAVGGGALWVRLALIVPALAERALTPVGALRLSWELTRGVFWRLLGAMALYLVGGAVVTAAVGSALGVVLMVIARALGAPEAGLLVSTVLFRVVGATMNAGFQLLVAALYRQLAAARP